MTLTNVQVTAAILVACCSLMLCGLIRDSHAGTPCETPPGEANCNRVTRCDSSTQRVEVTNRHLRTDGTVAWTRTDTYDFGHWVGGQWVDHELDVLPTYLAPLDPDPWHGDCRARAHDLDGRRISDWSNMGMMDGKPVPVPEPSRDVLVLVGVAAMAALVKWRERR